MKKIIKLGGDTVKVSIVVATTRTDCLISLLESIKKNTKNINYEVIVVTKSLDIWELDVLHKHPVRVINEKHSRGCVHAFNEGFKSAIGEYTVWINDDCIVQSGWLEYMLETIGNSKSLGAFYIKEPDTNGYVVNTVFDMLYANFGCIRSDVLRELGYWDETFVHYGADPDFALKMYRAGYSVVSDPRAKIDHMCVDDNNRKEELRAPAWNKLVKKWQGIFC